MIIVLYAETKEQEIEKLCQWLRTFGVETHPIIGDDTIVIGLVGDTTAIDQEAISQQAIVDKVIKVQEPYKRANRKFHPENTVIQVDNIFIGGNELVMIAGPCSVETETQLATAAAAVKDSGASLLRGGAFKPRSSPYAFQGLKAEGLLYLVKEKEKTGMPIVSEITSVSQIELFERMVDVIQVGARNMQNFELLKQLGQMDRPILLKRGFSNTIEELLLSAEYLMAHGNEKIILCERGIRTFETATRNTLDVSSIPVLKRLTHLPVIADPSHAGGKHWLVKPLALAAIAAGADGLEIEVHHDPAAALSDGPQALTPKMFAELMPVAQAVAKAIGRTF